MLLDKEKEAIEVLKSCGWQIITGAYLEDWDEGQSILKDGYAEMMEIRSEIAIIKM